MTSINTTKGLAARLGGWSARHKKSVLAGWFVFVALAMMVSTFVPANKLTKADQFTGESGRAEKTLESNFPKPAVELVLIHSATLTTDDATFKRAIKQTTAGFAGLSVVDHLKAPGYGSSTGLVSEDRHTAMIQFDIKGDADTASDRIAPVLATIKSAQAANPSFRIEEFGDATSGAAIDKKVEGDLKKAETMSLPDHPADPGARLRRARRGRRAGAARDLGGAGHDRAGLASRARSSRSTTTPRS